MITTLIVCIISASPTSGGAIAPNLVETKGGAWMTWIEPVDTEKNIVALRCSKFDDEHQVWGDALTVVQGTNFFANWADFPEMGVAKDGTLFVTWPQQSGPGAYAYDIAVARSDDSGETWSLMGTLNDDRVLGEHGFVSLVPEGDNGVRAFWLDGRAMTGDGHMGEGGGDMQLRTTIIDDKVQKSELLDDRVCECCQTDAVVVEGEAVVIYRDRSDTEIRDISISGIGRTPKNIFADQWSIEGCPVNGPSMDVLGDTFVAAWYTSPSNKSAVYVTFSEEPIKVSSSILGRVDVLAVGKDKVTVCWLEPNGDTASVTLADVHRDGTIENKQIVAQVSPLRSSGFPRLAKVNGGILVAWTDLDREVGISTNFFPN
jgi:hypothetical protein